MNLHCVVYVSTAIVELEDQHLVRLLHHARAANQRLDITGILLYGAGRFLQVLEGPAEAVRQLYARIAADPRHGRLELLADGPVAQREFTDWHMSFALLPNTGLSNLLGYLTPAQALRVSAPGATVQHVLREFVESSNQVLRW